MKENKNIGSKVIGSLDSKFESTNRVYDVDASCPTLSTMQGGNQEPKILEVDKINTVNTSQNQDIRKIEKPVLLGGVGEENEFGTQYRQGNRVYDSNSIAMCLTSQPVGNAGGNSYLYNVNYRIRKLTPRECWRLMGFNDSDFEKAQEVNSNTQLYKQAGNSIVKNVLMAIFSQMNITGIKRWNDIHKENI
ncbi:MAG: DNA cytosine methyltransferase [Eisenbergiella sp.]